MTAEQLTFDIREADAMPPRLAQMVADHGGAALPWRRDAEQPGAWGCTVGARSIAVRETFAADYDGTIMPPIAADMARMVAEIGARG